MALVNKAEGVLLNLLVKRLALAFLFLLLAVFNHLPRLLRHSPIVLPHANALAALELSLLDKPQVVAWLSLGEQHVVLDAAYRLEVFAEAAQDVVAQLHELGDFAQELQLVLLNLVFVAFHGLFQVMH